MKFKYKNERDYLSKRILKPLIEINKIKLTITDKLQGLKQYIVSLKRYFIVRVMKSLVGEFTQSEKCSVKGSHMGN